MMVPAPLPVPPLNSTDRMHSAQFRTSNRQHALHVAGADAYVAKFAAKELADSLRQVLARYEAVAA